MHSKNKIQHILGLTAKQYTGLLITGDFFFLPVIPKPLWQLELGNKALILSTTSSSKLLIKWQGPFKVIQWVGEGDYEVLQMDRRSTWQTYHLNLLKQWNRNMNVYLDKQVIVDGAKEKKRRKKPPWDDLRNKPCMTPDSKWSPSTSVRHLIMGI